MRFPTIHPKGTSANHLHERYRRGVNGLWDAIQALRDAAPHEKDYSLQEGKAFIEAMEEHRARARKLHEIHKELVALLEHVARHGG